MSQGGEFPCNRSRQNQYGAFGQIEKFFIVLKYATAMQVIEGIEGT